MTNFLTTGYKGTFKPHPPPLPSNHPPRTIILNPFPPPPRPTIPRLRRRRLQRRSGPAGLHLHPGIRSEARHPRVPGQDREDGQHGQRPRRRRTHGPDVRRAGRQDAQRAEHPGEHGRGAHAVQLRPDGGKPGEAERVADLVGESGRGGRAVEGVRGRARVRGSAYVCMYVCIYIYIYIHT